MDSCEASPEKVKMGPSFRKLSSDTANRSYRRPTNASLSDSSSSDENNEHGRRRDAISQKNSAKVKDEDRNVERKRSYSRTEKDHDRYSDRYLHRESRRHEVNDRMTRDFRHGDESARDYARSSRSERSDNFDHKDKGKDREKEHDRYTSRRKDVDSGRDRYYKERNSKEYYDDRRGSHKSPERYDKNEKLKERSRYRETNEGEIEGVGRRKRSEQSSFGREEKKRETKFSKPADTNLEDKASSRVKQVTEASKPEPDSPASMIGNQTGVGADLNSAKVAAMKAAESVNKNIGGAGVGGQLTTEQKKKLLWGNKKNESAGAETVKSWNNLFMDRERQEKFNKLMGVKGNVVPENKPEEEANQQGKSREVLDMDLEKQYTAGLRRRDGRTVGLGL